MATVPNNKPGLIHPPGPRLRRFIPLRFVLNRQKSSGKSTYAELNLTSMVDMLTIIVVFLLQLFTSSGQVDVVNKDLALPKITHAKTLRDAKVIVITHNKQTGTGQIIFNVDGKDIQPVEADTRALLAQNTLIIDSLRKKIERAIIDGKLKAVPNEQNKELFEIPLILALSEENPHELMIRAAATCASLSTELRRISVSLLMYPNDSK